MSTQRQSRNQGFLETCIGVIFNPVPTGMRTIVRQRPIGWALIVIIVISVAQGIAGAASLDPSDLKVTTSIGCRAPFKDSPSSAVPSWLSLASPSLPQSAGS